MIHMPTEFEDILTDLDSEFKRAFPNRNYQEEYKKIEQKIQKENFSYDVFLRILMYKRSGGCEIDEETVRKTIESIKNSPDEEKMHTIMKMKLKGTQHMPTASALLHFLFPENFAIVDKNTWRAFKKLAKGKYRNFCDIDPDDIKDACKKDVKQYQVYNKFVIKLKKHHKKERLRDIEKALMIYGKKIYGKKIARDSE